MRRTLILPVIALAVFLLPGIVTLQAADNTGTGGTIMYTDASGSNAVASPPYVSGYVVHTFTNSGTYSNSYAVSADVLVVAGGGGGGVNGGGGGGAGGVLYTNAFSVAADSNYTVTVGSGGAGAVNNSSVGSSGTNSVFGTLIALGGGGGSSRDGGPQASSGGSGGGGGGSEDATRRTAGSGTAGQGNSGGNGIDGNVDATGGGGGGAGAPGIAGAYQQAGDGGPGVYYAAFADVGGSPGGWFGGGGGGGRVVNGSDGFGGTNGGGGDANVPGVPNTGGGGGGGGQGGAGSQMGGSGIVIIRYPYDPGGLAVSVTSPMADHQFLPGSSVTATVSVVNGQAPYDVTFYTNSAVAWSTNGSSTNLFTIDLGVLANGTYTNYAYVSDNLSSNYTSVTNTFTVAADTNAPDPDPMTFAVAPSSLNSSSIVMTASTATDTLSPPVQYYFFNASNAANSGWISSTVWTNMGLTQGTTYGYQVKARDAVLNETTYSVISDATPLKPVVTWDNNAATGPDPSDGGGTWLNTDQWWDGAAHTTWDNSLPPNAIIGSGGNGGTITLGAVTNGTVSMDNFSGTYILNGGSLETSGGITIGSSAGTVSLFTELRGAGGITHNGPGRLTIANINSTITGNIVANDGILELGNGYGSTWNKPPFTGVNIELNDTVLELWWPSVAKAVGTGANEVQLTGGTVGFVQRQGDRPGSIWNPGPSVTWGTPTFNPSALVLCANSDQSASYMDFSNNFDLNGTNRAVGVGITAAQVSSFWYGRVTGVISNGAATPAGIIKTGIGPLRLSANNTFDGPVQIEKGTLEITSMLNGGVASQMGASDSGVTNLVLRTGGVLEYIGSGQSSDRGFSIDGDASGGSGVIAVGAGAGALNLTSTNSPGWGAVNEPRTVVLGGSSFPGIRNTLAAHIADNGTAEVSVAKTNVSVWVLTGTNSYTGTNTLYDGTLVASSSASLSGWNVAGKVVFEGGTLAVSVGGSGFSTAEVDTLLSSATKNSGAIGFDTSSGDLTQWRDFTAAWLGPLGIAKLGANKLTLDRDNASSYSLLNMFEGTVDVDANVSVSNLFLNGPNTTVSGSGSLDFVPGGLIADKFFFPDSDPAADVNTIACGISGSPDVHMTKSDDQEGQSGVSILRFEPSANSTQTLGDIEFNHPGGSQGAVVILAGASSNNTLGSVYKVAAHSYSQHLTVEGPGKWTLNGDIGKATDVNPVEWKINGGTLIVNGSNVNKPYLEYVDNGRLGGNFTYGPATIGLQIRSGGILSPGDGGAGTMSFTWGGSDAARSFQLADNSIFEYDVGSTTNDLVAVTHSMGTAAFTLDLNNFVLKIQDAGGSPKGEPLTVFTYNADVTVDMSGFSNAPANFDLSDPAVSTWGNNGLVLSNDVSAGAICLVGLNKPPGGTVLIIK